MADPRDTDNDDIISWDEQVAYQGRVDTLNAKNAADKIEKDRQGQFMSTLTAVLGEPPTADDITKYSPYIDNLAALQVIVGKDVALRPAKGTYSKDINEQLMSTLGREATPSELNYFGKQMEQGNLDTYGLQSFIKGTEEFQTNYTKKAREELKTELGATDQEYLNKVDKSLQAKYAGMGRSGAGAFGSAMITAGKDLASERGSYLANIGYQGAQQGMDTLKSQYQQNLNQMYNSQQQSQGLGSESRNRYYSTQDLNKQLAAQTQMAQLGYATQQNNLALQNRYNQQNQPSTLQALAPAAITAAAYII